MTLFIGRRARRGFTLIEIIVVIGILGILSAIAIPRFSGITSKSKEKVDIENLNTLNRVSQIYASKNNCNTGDIFCNITSDEARMQTLVNNALLSQAITPLQEKNKFKWNKGEQLWYLGPDSIKFTASGKDGTKNIQDLLSNTTKSHTWGGNNDGGIKSSYGTLFEKNTHSEYTITSKARLSDGKDNNGGYGIFFETSVGIDPKKDSGYVLQFDRGLETLIVRKRIEGQEQNRDQVFKVNSNFGKS